MKQKVDFRFKFKENRKYVHGTDLYNTVISFLEKQGFKEISEIEMTFHKIIRTNTTGYLCSDDEIIDMGDYAFNFNFTCNETNYSLFLKENGEAITEKYSYPEESITQKSLVDENSKEVTLTDYNNYSNIEKIVALNKHLLESLYPDISGKWYFSRLQLNTGFAQESYQAYKLKLVKNMAFKLTKTIIFVDDDKIGTIYFTLSK